MDAPWTVFIADVGFNAESVILRSTSYRGRHRGQGSTMDMRTRPCFPEIACSRGCWWREAACPRQTVRVAFASLLTAMTCVGSFSDIQGRCDEFPT